jgi:hypothetical protein
MEAFLIILFALIAAVAWPPLILVAVLAGLVWALWQAREAVLWIGLIGLLAALSKWASFRRVIETEGK